MKRKSPYTHLDGSPCWTKNCSLGNTSTNTPTFLKSYEDYEKHMTQQTDSYKLEQFTNNIKHKYEGVSLDLRYSEYSNNITLNLISIPKEQRNQGLATTIMSELIEYADREGKTVSLTPVNDFGSAKNRLEAFYRRFGFVMNKGRNKDFRISELMIRFPE